MFRSHSLKKALLALASLLMLTFNALGNDPGIVPGRLDGADSDSPGGFLVYNLYASSASNPAAENTRISITNASDERDISVHFFYIDGSTCSVADNYICLTKNQTATVYASDVDPGVKGYIIAIATTNAGVPFQNNRLLGDAFVKLATGHTAQLPAQVIKTGSVRTDFIIASIDIKDAPRVLAIPSISSPAEGSNTLLVVNRISGDLHNSMNSVGNMFGVLYDQLENPYSWTASGRCQLMATLGPNFPRTAPRIGNVIPAGSVGWMKFWSTSPSELFVPPIGRSITGCYLNFNANAGNSGTAYNGGRNLAQLTLNSDDEVTLPVFPSNCGFVDEEW